MCSGFSCEKKVFAIRRNSEALLLCLQGTPTAGREGSGPVWTLDLQSSFFQPFQF